MRRAGLLALLLTLAGAPAVADVAPTPPSTPGPPLSVWRFGDQGAEHLQSGLVCPARFGEELRTQTHVYDRFGLDVSCNYKDALGDVTLYLTRRSGIGIDGVYQDAKRSFLQVHGDAHPQLLSESHPSDGGLAWEMALYADDGGLRDMIWVADLDGWSFTYRATYRAEAEPQVRADIAEMTGAVLASAGARLALCAKSPPPARTGAPITDPHALEPIALMAAILPIAPPDAAAHGAVAAPPTTWCVDHTASAGPTNLILWRGVAAGGTDAGADQITAMTQQAPLALTARAEPAALAAKGGDGQWVATTDDGVRVAVWGAFTARPAPTALARLYLNVLAGAAHPLSGFDRQTKTVSIGMPQK